MTCILDNPEQAARVAALERELVRAKDELTREQEAHAEVKEALAAVTRERDEALEALRRKETKP